MSNLPANLEPTILYQDADIVAINKPAGLVVHPDGRTRGVALTDWVLEKFPEAAAAGEDIQTAGGGVIKRPGIVHRLDRDTSGVMLIARTPAGHAHLKAQFHAHTIEKKYLAFVHGVFEDNYGIIDRPIGRSATDFRKKSASRGAEGDMRDAMTWYTVKGQGIDGVNKASLIEAEPKTGRTHQIRVHMQAVHHPVLSDPLYATGKPHIMGFNRLALHARNISWDGLDGKRMKAVAQLPADFESALREYFKGVKL
jgi:23S rRNA pseudouridine1911/1915/1917 synthase